MSDDLGGLGLLHLGIEFPDAAALANAEIDALPHVFLLIEECDGTDEVLDVYASREDAEADMRDFYRRRYPRRKEPVARKGDHEGWRVEPWPVLPAGSKTSMLDRHDGQWEAVPTGKVYVDGEDGPVRMC